MRLPLIILFGLLSSVLISQNNENYEAEPANIYESARYLAFQENDFSKAISLINEEITSYPRDLQLQIFRSKLYFWNNNHAEATSQLLQLLELRPDNYKAYNLLADIYESQGLFIEARRYLKEGLSHFHNDQKLQFRMAYNLQQTQEYTSSIVYCEKVLKQNSDHVQAQALKKVLDSKLNKNVLIAGYRNNFLNETDQQLSFYNIQYGRRIKKTTLVGMVNSAKANQQSGLQYSLEMYNSISDRFYTNLNIGYSRSTLFPTHKISVSLYNTMNHGIESSIYVNIINIKNTTIRILAPSISKYYKNSLFTGTVNFISDGIETEFTYRLRYRQFIRNHRSFAGIAFGSFSRDETIGYSETNQFRDKYISYETQITFKSMILGISYNRNLNKFARSRDQFTSYVKHTF